MSLEKIGKRIELLVNTCMNTSISLLKVMLLSKPTVKLPQAVTESCIVLGNGPSLKQSLEKHPDFFNTHKLLCVNSFSLTKEYIELRPSYYVMLDPGFWKGAEPLKKIIDTIIEVTTWDLQLLLPQQARSAVLLKDIQKRNPKIKLNYFNYTVYKGMIGLGHFLYRKNMAMPQSQNVLVASLFLCINMHFKEIFMVGADHSWHENLHVNDANQVCLKDFHFYDQGSNIGYRLFYKDGNTKEMFSMNELFITLAKAFSGYEQVKKYADYRNVTIWNASEVSFVDAFTRKKIE